MKSIFEKTKKMSDIEELKKDAVDGWKYASQRMDLLIISISGAGIYVCLEAMKYAHEHHYCNAWLIKLSGVAFVIGIGINFISQYTGKMSNKYELFRCEEEIEGGESPTDINIGKVAVYENKANTFTTWTNRFNNISAITMFVGLLVLVMYFMFTF